MHPWRGVGLGNDASLVAESLSVSLGGRSIVSHVDLVVNRNEVVGLIGSNGAGKST